MSVLDPNAVESKLYLNQPLTAEESRALSSLLRMMSACLRVDLGKSEPDSVTGYRLLEQDYHQHFAQPTTTWALRPSGAAHLLPRETTMAFTSDGILAYGFNLGGTGSGWDIEQVGEYGEWEPDWVDEDGDIIDGAEKRLLTAAGFTETDARTTGYHERRREAQARVGVELEPYCSGDHPVYLLAAHRIRVYRGGVKTIDFAALEAQRVSEDWDGKLRRAVEVLGITPEQAEPAWLLVSYMGWRPPRRGPSPKGPKTTDATTPERGET